jgi:hypothetical protein
MVAFAFRGFLAFGAGASAAGSALALRVYFRLAFFGASPPRVE